MDIPDEQKLTLVTGDGQEINMKNQDSYSAKDVQGKLTNIKIRGATSNVPEAFGLLQNTPNPFSRKTVVSYRLPVVSKVSLIIYDISGRCIRTLVNARQEAGHYEVTWDGKDDLGNKVKGGIYFYQIKADHYVNTRKMILLH